MAELEQWLEIERLRQVREANYTYVKDLDETISKMESDFIEKYGKTKIEIEIEKKGEELASETRVTVEKAG